MNKLVTALGIAVLVSMANQDAFGQRAALPRLGPSVLDAAPPSARIAGEPGAMTVRQSPCRTLPTADTRRRIVDIAVQEWAFFGFPIVAPDADEFDEPGRRRRRLSPEESARVASSIAGYWAVTTEGSWIVSNQNKVWTGPEGIGSRWNAPWSAAFVSWVMCESGLGAATQFQRAIAHHSYIDQAIRARDGGAPRAAFAAYEPGEAAVEPGDLLCTARRPAYRTLAERRRQLGEGARTHCDIVVKVDAQAERIYAIGGNVGRAVSLKLLPASLESGSNLRPVSRSTDARPVFAHLKLRANPIEMDALDASPTIKAACASSNQTAAAVWLRAALAASSGRC